MSIVAVVVMTAKLSIKNLTNQVQNYLSIKPNPTIATMHCYILGFFNVNIMKNKKLYFLNIDDTNCYPLSDRLNDARLEGLEKVTLVEAVPDNDNPDYVWCAQHGEVTERQECKKAVCSYYESKSGRGVCSNRGNLYCHGDEVTFDVPKEAGI